MFKKTVSLLILLTLIVPYKGIAEDTLSISNQSSKKALGDNNTKTKKWLDANLSFIAEIQLLPNQRYLVYKIAEMLGPSVNKECLEYLVKSYYKTKNTKIRWQIRTFVGELKKDEQLNNIKDLFKKSELTDEADYELFFSVVPSLLHRDQENDVITVLDFLANNVVPDTPYSPIWFADLQSTKHLDLLHEILDLKTSRSKSLLNFLLSLGVIANINSEKSKEKMRLVYQTSSNISSSESATGITHTLRGVYEDLEDVGLLNRGIDELESKKEYNPKWEKKFKKMLLSWDESLSDPKRLKLRKQQKLISKTEKDISLAKYHYLSSLELSKVKAEKASFEAIINHLNTIRINQNEPPLTSISELENEVGKEILSLGSYETPEGIEGDSIDWGVDINYNPK